MVVRRCDPVKRSFLGAACERAKICCSSKLYHSRIHPGNQTAEKPWGEGREVFGPRPTGRDLNQLCPTLGASHSHFWVLRCGQSPRRIWPLASARRWTSRPHEADLLWRIGRNTDADWPLRCTLPKKLVRESEETASKRSSELRAVDATDRTYVTKCRDC